MPATCDTRSRRSASCSKHSTALVVFVTCCNSCWTALFAAGEELQEPAVGIEVESYGGLLSWQLRIASSARVSEDQWREGDPHCTGLCTCAGEALGLLYVVTLGLRVDCG